MGRTVSDLHALWLDQTHESLMRGKHIYQPAIKFSSHLRNKGDIRPITVGSSKDKVIQKAFVRVLEVVYDGLSTWEETDCKTYNGFNPDPLSPLSFHKQMNDDQYHIRKWVLEPIFKPISHAFRPGRNVHTAVQQIYRTWRPVSWFMPVCVEGSLETINKHVLVNQLLRRVDDQRVIDEIYKMMTMGIVNFQLGKQWRPGIGMPNGSSLSPFLLNVYMHYFDEFMLDTIEKYASPIKTRKINPEFLRLTNINEVADKSLPYSERLRAKNDKRAQIKSLGITKYITEIEDRPNKIYCVRYGDEILLGFEAQKDLVKDIVPLVSHFLKSSMHLKVKSMVLKHARSDYTPFQGFNLQQNTSRHRVRSREVEAFKRKKGQVLRRGATEYETYLKMIEWLGKKAIIDGSELCKDPSKSRLSKNDLESKFKELAVEGKWAVPLVHKNKFLEKAHMNRNDQVEYRVERWLRASQSMIGSHELVTLGRLIGNDLSIELMEAREEYQKKLKQAMSKATEGGFIGELQEQKTSLRAKSEVTLLRPVPNYVDIFCPMDSLRDRLRAKNILSPKGVPCAVSSVMSRQDHEIIYWFSMLAKSILNYYGCAVNHLDIRKTVNWTIRYSLFATLASKHKKSTKWVIRMYGKEEPKVVVDGVTVAKYPHSQGIMEYRKRFSEDSSSLLVFDKLLRPIREKTWR